MGGTQSLEPEFLMFTNFVFGSINVSLVFTRL